MKNKANLKWVWGLKETVVFESREAALNFIKINEEAVESATTCSVSNHQILPKDQFYSPSRNFSDHEMDIYL